MQVRGRRVQLPDRACATLRWAGACLLLVASAQAADPLTRLGLRASDGAAPGYLADAACAQCHPAIARSYAEVGMARSFAPAAGTRAMAFDGSRYAHAASGLDYRLQRRGDELWFAQSAKAADGSTLSLELRVDWVLGSGNRAQSFLHHTEAGELYQLPVTWYSESGALAMSPGYEAGDHPGVERRVRRQCMFCHNAYPEVALGSDRADQPDLFPRRLPAGVGCQRCHGPGAEHVRVVLTGKGLERIHAAIVNPSRLAWPERNDVCFQCHLLPAVEVVGARRIDRADYSFRPGEPLRDYLLHVDIDEAGRPRDQRFQINHHAYRLLQSACYIESKAQMGCVSCHDPHVRRVGAVATGWYRDRCLACHQDLERRHGLAAADAITAGDQRDCAGCHMPKRRTQDVIEVTMTDHRIARGPFDRTALVAPLQPRAPEVRDLQLLARPAAMSDPEAAAYRALIALDNNIGGVDGARALARNLQRMPDPDASWWLQLARHQIALGQHTEADASIARMDRPTRESASARQLSALIDVAGGRVDAGLRTLRRLSRRGQFQPELDYNLALLERRKRRLGAAIRALERVVEVRPLSAAGWLQLARTWTQDGDQASADRAYQRALSIRPALQTEAPPLTTHD
jgi:predicted CXXCH cytochrome family protein